MKLVMWGRELASVVDGIHISFRVMLRGLKTVLRDVLEIWTA